MHYHNRLLFLFCAVIIVFMGFMKNLTVNNNAKKQPAIEISGGSANKKSANDAYNHLLIKYEDGGTHTLAKKKIIEKSISKPYISAESYIVGNLETGEIYISKNPDRIFPIASVSKLYSAVVVHHLFNIESKITITQSMLDTYGDAGHLSLGEKFLPNELLYPLLLESSNDAAQAYAEFFGAEKFIGQMNDFTKEIGMNKTHFKDPSGLNQLNLSNASDLFTLAKYLYKNEKEILAISRIKEFDFPKTDDHESHKFININPYSNYTGFIGGKTGRTEWAKETMVSLFNQEVDGITYPIAVIILRSDIGEREIDTDKLVGKFMDKVKVK